MQKNNKFSTSLLNWHSQINRYLPWKETNDVFHIWLSEIILQQTRVEQGLPYFLKFRERFENIFELAKAEEQEVMKLWEGLGYYSRARNMHYTAKQIAENGGNFPDTYEGLLALKGVGPYTAAAIASFAYNIPVSVMDGNVQRVISRIYGITDAIDTKVGKDKIATALNIVFDSSKPAEFNQAIMDFGATQCLPKNPNCDVCPFEESCIAYKDDLISIIPYKSKKIIKKERVLHYVILGDGEKMVIRKRVQKDIWKHLNEFVLLEKKSISKNDIKKELKLLNLNIENETIKKEGPFKHVLTHQNLKVYFYQIEISDLSLLNGPEYFLVERKNLRKFAFPKIIDWYLKEKSIYLNKK